MKFSGRTEAYYVHKYESRKTKGSTSGGLWIQYEITPTELNPCNPASGVFVEDKISGLWGGLAGKSIYR